MPRLLDVTILNKGHYPITVQGVLFNPYEEVKIEIETTSSLFYELRVNKNLRIGKLNNEEWLKKHKPEKIYKINAVYDAGNQHRGRAYVKAIEALANPILKHLDGFTSSFVDRPQPGVNIRFFSSMRIRQQGKSQVGPYDVFMSHGIGDKDYWTGPHIADYKFALVPGRVWKERMRLTGYKGEIFEVGYTKLDPLFQGEYVRTERKKPYIVWAPTHGYVSKHRGRSSYPQCLTLISEIPSIYEKHLALHPTSKINKGKNQDVTMQALIDADVVIADAGSTLYEAWALGKPVIFPDWLCKADILSHFEHDNLEYKVYEQSIGYHAKDMGHLIKLIDVALNKGMGQQETEFIEDIFPTKFRGVSGANSALVLKQIHADTLGR